jgi:hypothetical protein
MKQQEDMAENWEFRQGQEHFALIEPKKRIPALMHGWLTKRRVEQRQHPKLPSSARRTNTSDRRVSNLGN